MNILCLLVVSSALIYHVHAACFSMKPKLDKCGDPFDCKYNCHTIAKGSSWKDYETCVKCTCAKDGSMRCCGFGYKAGVIAVPPECKLKKLDRCRYRIVYKKNPCKLCRLPRKYP